MGIKLWFPEDIQRVLDSHQAAFLIGYYANDGKADDELALIVCDLYNALRLSFGIGGRAGDKGR